jgi:hypothetical protein
MAKWGRKKIRSGNCCFYAQDIGWTLLLESVDIYYLLGLFQATSKTPWGIRMYGRKECQNLGIQNLVSRTV